MPADPTDPIVWPPDLDPDTIPKVNPREVARTEQDGKPTQWALNWEQGQQAWFKKTVVDLNERLTKVYSETDFAYAAVTTLAEAFTTSEEAFAAYTVTVEARFQDVEASVVTETTARVTADEALASDITTLTSELGTTNASLSTEITTRAAADTAIAGQITTLNSNLGTTNANLTSEASTRASADSALSSSVSSLSTTVGGHTSTLATQAASINGIAVKYGVTGTINGVTGGFIFTGIQQVGGGAVFNLEINANVTINGNLIVNGTILNGAAANRAFTQGVGSSSGGMGASVSLTTRGSAQVAVIANFNGLSGFYAGLGTSVGVFKITRNGGTLQSVANNFEASGSGGSAGISFQQTCVLAVDTPPAGFNTFECETTNGAGLGGVTIAVIELSK